VSAKSCLASRTAGSTITGDANENIAIATGLVMMRGRREERAFAMRIRHTGVWAHNGEDWFRVAFHDTCEQLDA
jgi:hypothetical protein